MSEHFPTADDQRKNKKAPVPEVPKKEEPVETEEQKAERERPQKKK